MEMISLRKIPFSTVMLAGVSLNEYGMKIPSPFSSLNFSNSQIASMSSWTLEVIVGGDSNNKINIAAFEALLYQSAQNASNYSNSSSLLIISFASILSYIYDCDYSAVTRFISSSKSVLVKLILFLMPNKIVVMMLSGKSIAIAPPSM